MSVNAVQTPKVSRAILSPDDLLDIISRMLFIFFLKLGVLRLLICFIWKHKILNIHIYIYIFNESKDCSYFQKILLLVEKIALHQEQKYHSVKCETNSCAETRGMESPSLQILLQFIIYFMMALTIAYLSLLNRTKSDETSQILSRHSHLGRKVLFMVPVLFIVSVLSIFRNDHGGQYCMKI